MRSKTITFLFAACFSLLSWAVFLQVSYGEPQAQEYELKAVYLYNFTQFVQWPESKRPSADGAMVIGIVGESPFGDALKKLQENVRKNGMKSIRIVNYGQYREGIDIDACHLLFVSASEKKNFKKIIADLKDAPVLTVADTGSFLSAGGMIDLVQSKGKIRWMINRIAANRAGLRLSAQLLSIAIKVMDES